MSGFRARLIWLSAVLVCALFAPSTFGRERLSLDGEWSFRMDPADRGVVEQWAGTQVRFTDSIRVPGAWDAQGFGGPTDKLQHNSVGKAWYKRVVSVPAEWAGQHVFLCVEGVHRSAEVWVNGRRLGEHIGYLSQFSYTITPSVQPGQEAVIAICVDSRQDWSRDCLTGCVDLIDEMFTAWGGIAGHVWLEPRAQAWIHEARLDLQVSPARCTAQVAVSGHMESADQLRLEVAPVGGGWRAKTETLDLANPPRVNMELAVPDAKLWSPQDPQLHMATVSLLKEGRIIDQVQQRIGFREIRTHGPRFLLNGKPLYLCGYGDDAIYPETMAPPCDKAFYVKRLTTIKSYGFNFVRHHSHMLPQEYYDAADEVGMLVSAEFPIAYQEYYNRAKGPALELYQREWAAAIRRLRHHPCIFDWSMGNELYDSTPIGPELYREAKLLDPLRLVIDSDGLNPAGFLAGTQDRASLDFFAVQFDPHVLPLDRPDKHRVSGTPLKPVVCHETGNYVTFPRADAIEQFRHNVKPFWLAPVREKLRRLGLEDQQELWAANSERLYLLCHKLNLEDLRKQPNVSGYTWWLFQDYWTGSNGIVDHYFRPKSIKTEDVLPFNGPVVLLLDGLQQVHQPGPLELRLLVSNYSTEPLERVAVQLEAEPWIKVRQRSEAAARCPVGTITELQRLTLELPEVDQPVRLALRATLRAAGGRWSNNWSTWVYPPDPAVHKPAVPLLAEPSKSATFRRYEATGIPEGSSLPAEALYLTDDPDPRVLDAVNRGACLLMLSPQSLFDAVPNRFKTCWWIGNAADSNVGTVVADHPLVRPLAPDGWCDASWHALLEGGTAAVLDDLPAQPEVLVRAIDVHSQCRSKAMLFQARLGAGSIVVCGLNLAVIDQQSAPQSRWLLDRLIEHAASLPRPQAELPLEWVRERVGRRTLPAGDTVRGVARVLAQAETAVYPDYRGLSVPMHVCRQLQPGQAVEWESAPLPAKLSESVALTFAGGLGWRSQPAAGGFELLVNGQPLPSFDVTDRRTTWQGTPGAELLFIPRRSDAEDSMGLFHLRLPSNLVQPGKPCRLAVESKAEGSRRWFGLGEE